MIKIGIVGGTGFTAGELLRILANHPQAEVNWIYSRSQAGQGLESAHADLEGLFNINYTDQVDWKIEVVFLCLPHGAAKTFVEENEIPAEIKIIDLSRDYRLEGLEGFVYGLPELNRDAIIGSHKIANPGCFATCIQLGLLPLASKNGLENDIHVTAITGSTGAGKGLSPTTHFTWRTGNLSVYKSMKHQHIGEITQSLKQLQPNFNKEIIFVPMRGNFTRGILASIYTTTGLTQEEALELYQSYYEDHPFIHITPSPIDMKQVVNTNKAKISVNVIENKIHIVSTIDNLLKGASGQAVQNMNLICGLPESTGIRLKSIAY